MFFKLKFAFQSITIAFILSSIIEMQCLNVTYKYGYIKDLGQLPGFHADTSMLWANRNFPQKQDRTEVRSLERELVGTGKGKSYISSAAPKSQMSPLPECPLLLWLYLCMI